MRLDQFSVKKLCFLIYIGAGLSMTAITIIFYILTSNKIMILMGSILIVCSLIWLFLLIQLIGKRLTAFTSHLCKILDNMINGIAQLNNEGDSETLFSKINHRLVRLYKIMQENRHKVDKERQDLQMLVSDISHQVKTPVSNLKMVIDTLLSKQTTEKERIDFLQGIRNETEKLDFLFQAMVKTSRLETGIIRLEKKRARIYDTLAQAVNGIVYPAENKDIEVSVSCPEDLFIFHDSKWTAEALFNLLDNAVKYTPAKGKISVSVEQWEMYIKINIKDTGKGISESNQASIFRRFYREEEVHNEQGVGIGLYLTREIIMKQGGYIKVISQIEKGSTFCVFLPYN